MVGEPLRAGTVMAAWGGMASRTTVKGTAGRSVEFRLRLNPTYGLLPIFSSIILTASLYPFSPRLIRKAGLSVEP